MQHAGGVKPDMLIILNDNDMSISENVGGLNNYFSRIWASKLYKGIKSNGKKFLKNMKKNSCLINIGRGNAIEEKDLLNHLKKNKNFYAYLDVFKNEPLKSSSQFWKLPNVTITPHVAGVTAIEPSVKYMYSKI